MIRKPVYSICISHYNNLLTVENSLSSILNQIDDRFEIIVVDNFSNDGSAELLKKFESAGRIRLIQAHSSIGKARQIALEKSNGEYVVANLDLDDIFDSKINRILSQYHDVCNGDLLWVRTVVHGREWAGSSMMIAPRSLLLEIGGWHDLQRGEDLEVAARAAKRGKYKWSEFPLLLKYNVHPERKAFLSKFFFRYVCIRDLLRTGRAPFRGGEHRSLGQKVPLLLAKMSLPFCTKYVDPFIRTFSPFAPEFFANLT